MLSKRSTVSAMGQHPEKFIDICFTAPTLALIFGDHIALEASKRDMRNFSKIIVVEGCRTSCASKLLQAMSIAPQKTMYLSYKRRMTNGGSLTDEEQELIDESVGDVVSRIVAANS